MRKARNSHAGSHLEGQGGLDAGEWSANVSKGLIPEAI